MLSENVDQPAEQPKLEEITLPAEDEPKTALPHWERAVAAYRLVYGNDVEILLTHNASDTLQESDWFIRSYFGRLFATKNSNPLTKKFENLEQLLEWFDEMYPLIETDKNHE